jgi:hypothetical protein
MDDDREHTARSRQLARLPAGKKPPRPRAALAMAKSKAYQAAADAPATLRAYKTDLENFKAWCLAHGLASIHGCFLTTPRLDGRALPSCWQLIQRSMARLFA